MSILKVAESGVPDRELYGTYGISSVAFYQWGSKYDGLDAFLISEVS